MTQNAAKRGVCVKTSCFTSSAGAAHALFVFACLAFVSVFIELARNFPGRAQLILPGFFGFRPHPRQGSVAPAWKHLLFGLLGVSWPPRVRRRPLGASPTFAATLLGSGTLWGAATPPVRPQRRVKVVSLRLATSQCQTTELSFIACIRGHYLAQARACRKHVRPRDPPRSQCLARREAV